MTGEAYGPRSTGSTVLFRSQHGPASRTIAVCDALYGIVGSSVEFMVAAATVIVAVSTVTLSAIETGQALLRLF